LRKLGSDSADPFSPLPARPKGMWRRKYERLAAEFREAQTRLVQSLCGAARWSIRQQNHQIVYGRLATQREALRERTLELAAKQKEALSRRNWSLEALLSGPEPDFLTEDESREFAELRQRNGRMDDLERFAAANPDRFRMERCGVVRLGCFALVAFHDLRCRAAPRATPVGSVFLTDSLLSNLL
jgi:hypothetical protein